MTNPEGAVPCRICRPGEENDVELPALVEAPRGAVGDGPGRESVQTAASPVVILEGEQGGDPRGGLMGMDPMGTRSRGPCGTPRIIALVMTTSDGSVGVGIHHDGFLLANGRFVRDWEILILGEQCFLFFRLLLFISHILSLF